MSKTLEDLRNLVLVELNEDANSALASLPSGSGTNGIAISSTDNITRLLNDAKDEVCRTAWLVAASATQTVSSGDGPTWALSGFTFSGIAAMRAALDVTWTPSGGSAASLTYLSWQAMRDNYPARATASPGTPKYWSTLPSDPRTIEVYFRPNAAGTLTVSGYAIASDLVNDTDTIAWLPDDRYRVLVTYACAKLCRKRIDDAGLMARMPLFAREYDELRLRMRAEKSKELVAAYLDPLVPMSAELGGGGGDAGAGG